MDEPRVRSLEEAEAHVRALNRRILTLEQYASDHHRRFDTLQTPWPKRVWFWLQGWPWYDLNGKRQRRPWHRGD